MIYFDQVFMNNPCKCYLGDTLCCAVRSIPSFQSNFTSILQDCGTAVTNGNIASLACPSVPTSKLSLIQAQLGCAIGMIVFCGGYILVFIFACVGVCFGHWESSFIRRRTKLVNLITIKSKVFSSLRWPTLGISEKPCQFRQNKYSSEP